LKRYLFLLLFYPAVFNLFAQVGYVHYGHPVYAFLDRMDSQNIIEGYDQFQLPKTRKEIVNYLKIINSHSSKLNEVDIQILSDFLTEFEYDLFGTTKKYSAFIPKFGLGYLAKQNEKFLFYYTDSSRINFFVNGLFNTDILFKRDFHSKSSANSTIFQFGGEIRGSFYDKFGFSIRATNGTFLGSRELASNYKGLRYNYKLNTPQNGLGDDYFDETSGFLAADFKYINFKIGRDRINIGYGPIKTIYSANPPLMDYFFLAIKYKLFSFNYYHGQLLGTTRTIEDSLQGGLRYATEKYFVYHRIGLNFSKHFTLGIGEIAIYSRRNLDLSYLNPFNYFKSVEHANQDRDNTFLFLDFTNNSIKGLKFYGEFLIDDLDFGKIGTGWYGNKTLVNLGIHSSILYHYLPIDLKFQYIRIEPYVYAHRIFDNNFTNLDYPIVFPIEPNSYNLFFGLNYFPHYRWNFEIGFYYAVHGANITDENNYVIKNVGGSIHLGRRPIDSDNVKFLDGLLEYKRTVTFSASFEPINNYILKLGIEYNNNSLAKSLNEHSILSYFTLKLKL
jgi:hypothetical protein